MIGPRGLSNFQPLSASSALSVSILPLSVLHDVDDRRHAVVAADRHEVGRRVGAVLLLPGRDEALVLRVVEVGVVVVHGDEADRGRRPSPAAWCPG